MQAGGAYGKVRQCLNSFGEEVEATPSTAFSVLGLDSVPAAGDLFTVHERESDAREAAKVCSWIYAPLVPLVLTKT